MEHLTSSPLSNNALSEHKIGGCKNQLHLPNLERERKSLYPSIEESFTDVGHGQIRRRLVLLFLKFKHTSRLVSRLPSIRSFSATTARCSLLGRSWCSSATSQQSTPSQQTPAPLSSPRTDQNLPPATTPRQAPPPGGKQNSQLLAHATRTDKNKSKEKADACQVR